MKSFFACACLMLVSAVAGCSPTGSESLDAGFPPFREKTASQGVDIGLPSPIGNSPMKANTTIPLERDAEKRTALAGRTEQIYLLWNAALGDYRLKHGRWPASLPELMQHQPDLISLAPPPGFQLQLDPHAGEIYVTRLVP